MLPDMQSRSDNWRRFLVNLTLVCVSTVASFGVAEVVVRALGFYGANYFEIHNTILVDDPVLNWRYRPNSVSYFNDIVYQINERGFRDYLYPYAKQNNTYRIFLASDSVGFGTNVQMNDSYPKILERKLTELNRHVRFEVVNYSMPGLSIKQKFHLVELYAKQYTPDLIIIDFVMNDVEFETRKDPEREQQERCSFALIHLSIPCDLKMRLKHSAFLFLLKEAVESGLQRMDIEDKNEHYEKVDGDFYHQIYAKQETEDYLKAVFRSLKAYQDINGIPILVPIFPLIYEYSKYKWEDINNVIISLCNKNEILHVSLLQDFRRFPYNEMRVQRGDFGHPSVKGNTVAAQAIARTLASHSLLPQ
jgi:lysophospholipase L1-like esterase